MPGKTKKEPLSSHSEAAQEWVDAQVLAACEDREPGLYSRRQAFNHPRVLYRRWQRLNKTMGVDNTLDTWLTNGALGAAVAAVIIAAFYYLGRDRIGGEESGWLGVAVGLLVGGFLFYNRMIRDAFAETYVETMVSEYHSALAEEDDVTDAVVVYLQRLALYNRPEVFDGNQGRNGFKDKDAVVRLRLPYGKEMSDLRESEDYYWLPGDPSPLVLASAIMRYSLIRLVRYAGNLYRRHAVPRTQRHWSEMVKSSWQWIVTCCFIFATIIVVTQ